MPSNRREFLSHLSSQALLLSGTACFAVTLPGYAPSARADFNQVLLGKFPQGSFLYTILRKGSAIGTQRQEFRSLGADGLSVTTRVYIDVRLLGLSLFRFTQEIEETWQDGRLASLRSIADDDGDDRRVELKRRGGRLVGTYNGRPRDLPGTLIPSTLWHPDSVHQTTILDTLKGRERKVSVKDMGLAEADLPTGPQNAHHFAFSGEFNRELWYGLEGSILAAEMIAKDGSRIRQELQDAG